MLNIKKGTLPLFVVFLVIFLTGSMIGWAHTSVTAKFFGDNVEATRLLYEPILFGDGLTGLILGGMLIFFTSWKRLGVMMLIGIGSYVAAGMIKVGSHVAEARYVLILIAIMIIFFPLRYPLPTEKEG